MVKKVGLNSKILIGILVILVTTASVAGFTLSGSKINNSDGLGISGWNITLVNETMWTVTTSTNETGYYEFTNLLNGIYTVSEESKAGWTNVSALSRMITINDHDEQNVNFTNKPLVIVSDDFSAPELDTSLWTIVNPLGDATFNMVGTGTRDAMLSISVPAGTKHDIWVGYNNAPRIMQNTSNTDFEVEVKFQSIMNSQFQMQGVIIQEDANKFLRFDFENDGASTRILAATFTNFLYPNRTQTVRTFTQIGTGPSAVPMYMRIKRAGDLWTQSYSTNGVTWVASTPFTFNLKVTSVGPFAANANIYLPPPAHIGLIDYFFNRNSPIVPEDPLKADVSGFKTNSNDGTPIKDWNITISNSTMQKSTLTGIDGSYKFTNLLNGTYTVFEEMRSGWRNITPASYDITLIGQNIQNKNFTNQPLFDTYNISGYKINASNSKGLSGWNITINNSKIHRSVFTDNTGFYEFPYLENGTYTIFEELRPDWRNITPATQEKTITGQNIGDVNFTNQQIIPEYNVTGFKINASDGKGLSGWNITISNSTMQNSKLTDLNGSYTFSNLLNGSYTLSEEPQSNWTNVTPASRQIMIAGQDIKNQNFTNREIIIVSDDFSGKELNNSLWTIVNQNDAIITMTGYGTRDALLSITVPEGTVHDMWNGYNNAPRIMQKAMDTDFEIEVKFQSQLTTDVQIQGLIIQQDNNKYIRFSIQSDVVDTKIFAGTVDSGYSTLKVYDQISGSPSAVPVYMRVKRVGDQWTQNYSFDGSIWMPGVTFAYPIRVTSVGPFVGNNGMIPPAYTGLIDYFFNNNSPVVDEDAIPADAKFNVSGFKLNAEIGAGVQNWNITIRNTTMQTSQMTDPDGFYKFTGLSTGTYTVTEEMQSGWTNTTPVSREVILVDQDIKDINFTNRQLIKIFRVSGYKINASDGKGISGWNISIRNTTMQKSTLTDINGFYSINDLVNGSYTLFEEVKPNWINLTPASQNIAILGQDKQNQNFTNKPPVAIVSDDFSAPELNTSLWTKINPRNDATFAIVGSGTSDSLLSIMVPAGADHDIWNGYNNAPRIMQNVSNLDFKIEVKFQSLINKQYQMQGVIIQEDTNKFLRFDLESDGTNTRILAVAFANFNYANRTQSVRTFTQTVPSPLTVPMYMRIERVGDLWNQSYSTNGVNWITSTPFTYALKVTSLGPFAANAGYVPPAHTGFVDYFINRDSPLVPEDPLKANVSGFKTNSKDGSRIKDWNITIRNSVMQSSMLTDINGSYSFKGLPNGTYTVFEESRPGWINVTPASYEITLIGQNIQNKNFTNQPVSDTYNVSGYKINASDGKGLSGWNITINNSIIRTTISTNTNGYYEFPYLENGTYIVSEEMRSEWKNLTPVSKGITIQGQNIRDVNFTNQPITPAYNVSGYKINASDNKGISGWNITIRNSTMQKSMFTDLNGSYKFTNLENDTYTVSEEPQSNWTNVTPLTSQITISGQDIRNMNFTNKPLVIISDDFSAPELNTTIWTTFNPRNDAIISLVGTGTRDALLSISVPEGVEHDFWNGLNDAPRIMQNTSNKDFEIEVKFQSQVTSEIQMQGLIVQENDDKYIRFDIESDGYNTKVFAGTYTGGSQVIRNLTSIGGSPSQVPIYMRVKRAGDQWTQSHSLDGVTWISDVTFTYSMKVTSVGPFIGNKGYIPPAFTGLIDYVFNTNTPIIPEDALFGTKFNLSGFKINGSDGTGIADWNITLRNLTMQKSTLTGIDGSYNFSNLSFGTYTVTEEMKPYWMNVTPLSRNVTFMYDDIQDINFTNRPVIPSYNISGYKINASDGRGISGWNITIRNSTMETSKFTDINGFYNFSNVLNGTYTLTEESRQGWVNVSPSTQGRTISGQDIRNVNFSNRPIIPSYNLTGFVFNSNDNTGIVNWNVTISNSTMGISKYTDSNGFYNFSNLVNGTYNITQEMRPGWQNITPLSQNIIVLGSDRTNVNFFNKPLGVVSDDFSAPALNTSLWTKINPKNDASFTIEGTNTPNAVLNITIPGGSSHEVGTLGVNNASRIMQSVTVTDFEVEAKFQSVINKELQLQGIIIEQDKDNYIRMDFYNLGSKIYVYAANINNGVLTPISTGMGILVGDASNSPLPLYMRVKHVGNNWYQNYSTDGTIWLNSVSFSRVLTVTSVGPYIANEGGSSAQAFSGLIDYFFNTNSPIVNEDALKFDISGFMINDLNNNSRWDAGEPGMPNWKISLFNQNTGLEITNTTTGASGGYVFYNLTNGTYNVTEESKPDYVATNRTYEVVTISGNGRNNLNFTNYIPQLTPIVTTQPVNQTVKLGKNATFVVVAQGTNPLSYQWRKNGINISGATNPSYTTPLTTMSDNGAVFSVQVRNSLGSTISNPSTLMVKNIVSDDFNAATLNTSIWTTVNPRNDATFLMENTHSPNASLSILVPGGTSHDVWVGGNFAPRVMQMADNSNFEIETKFLSSMTASAQMQGIIVQEDSNKYIRFDFTGDATTTTMYVISFIGGNPTIRYTAAIPRSSQYYLRISRTGDDWTESYSYNGTTWTPAATFNFPMIVSSVGPFAGNGGSSPAFTSKIDYFFNTSSPSVPEDEPDTIAPNITLWYGKSQKFGQPGLAQRWVNILGNVNDASGVKSLNYSLNNGPVVTLSIGPDYRLESTGDFNIDLNATTLPCGINQLLIKASDTQGNSGNETVSVNYSCNNVWPQEYTINWSNVNNIQDAVQIADGLWTKEANSIRPAIIGYDRLITIGDMTWTDFEIIAPITINSPLDPRSSFGGPNFGFITRWKGHFPWDPSYPTEWIGKQPNAAWYPLGGLGAYIWDASRNKFILKIIGNRGDEIAVDASEKQLEVGIPYMFKMRAETNGTRSLYSLKVWQKNLTEPSAWTLSGYGVAGELKQGSATLSAHNANVSYGNVTIRPLSVADAFPIISDISVQANEYNATVRWITSKPASSNVSYGLSSAYQNGSVVDAGMVSSHAILLNGLTQGTTYHYMINSTDSGGNSTKTGDLTFATRAIFPPGITTQPTDQTTFNGSVATFNVVANGSAPLSYQWKKYGVDIPSATGPSYTTPVTSLADNGSKFTVVVSSPYGSITSNEVTLTVNEAPPVIWWNSTYRFRVPVTVGSKAFERNDKPAELNVNFTQVLSGLGQTGAFDENSLRVVETDSIGVVLDSTVPFQFDKDTGYNAAGKASGTIVFIMKGTTQPNMIRYYHIYFDTAGGSFTPLSVTPLVTLTDNVTDEGQSSYRIAVNGSTYYYQKAAGGFSSLVDSSGNDWISYAPVVGSAEYRGIPNVYSGGIFHPGFTCCTSSIITQGPLKVSVRSVSPAGWESRWDFYPGYATMTMVRAPANYYILYEGTPGGALEPNSDFMVRSDGTQNLLSQSWNVDIPNNEWAYFSDPAVGRSLFAAHHEDDTLKDTYWPYSPSNPTILTVFGFGRTDNPATGLLPYAVPQHVTFGLMNGTGFTQNSKIVYSAYKDLAISTSSAEQNNYVVPLGIATQPVSQDIPEGQTATFSVVATGASPLTYQWQRNGVVIPGANMATYTTPAITSADNGAKFKVVVSNILGSVTSNEATLSVSAPTTNQLVLLDASFEHNTTVSTLPPLNAITGKSVTFFNIPPTVPADLYSPIDYAHGTLYQRLEVFNKPSTKTVWYQICIFQDEITTPKHACTERNQLAFSSPGIYYQNQPLLSLYQAGNISWNRSLLIYMLDITDTNNILIDDRSAYNGGMQWDGYPNMNLYYPMTVRYTAILVPAGGGLPSWPSDQILPPPEVIGNAPTGTNVPIQAKISLNFSSAMDQATVQSAFSTIPATSGSFSWSGNNVTYTPALNLSYNTVYNVTVGTGARGTNGKYMVSPYSWQFTTVQDTTPPVVTGNTPTGTNVSIASKINVSFSKAMNISSVQSAFSTLPATAGGSFSWNGNNMTYTPPSNLAYSTRYNVTIGTGARDIVGNNMSSKYEWNFTTKDQDLTPPTVISNSPTGTDVNINSRINVTFSEEMNSTTAQSAFFTSPVTSGSFSWNGNKMTYTPDSLLAYSTTYTVTVGTGARDISGNSMSTANVTQFTTKDQDLTPPTVIGNSPTGTDVPLAAKIIVNFSEEMNTSTAQSAFSTSPIITGSFSWIGNNMTFTPASNLAYNTTYTVTVGTGAMDLSGNSMSSANVTQFTTIPDTMPPSVTVATPNGTGVPILSSINVTFSEAMDNASVESAFSISPLPTGGSFSWNGNTMKYTPVNLSYNTTYSVTIGTGAKDLAGNNMAAQYTWAFTTVPLAPNLVSNGGFESGTTPWNLYVDGVRTITLVSPGYEGNNAARLSFTGSGANVQLYQNGITLVGNTRYRVSFAAYSNTGHGVTLNMIRPSPYTSYSTYTTNLGTGWQTFSTEFTTGSIGTVTDARLQFWLTPFAVAGDIYYIDNVRLEKVI